MNCEGRLPAASEKFYKEVKRFAPKPGDKELFLYTRI